MGYRSEVVFAVAPPLVDKFLAVMAASEKVRDLIKYNEYRKEGIRFNFYNEGDIVVNLDGIKWYEGYEEVDKIKEFFDEAVDANNGDEEFIRFIRIGESPDDQEVVGFYEEDQLYIPTPAICW
jgi:signal peptidase I